MKCPLDIWISIASHLKQLETNSLLLTLCWICLSRHPISLAGEVLPKATGTLGPGSGGCLDREPMTSSITEAAVNPGIYTFCLWTGGQSLTPVCSKSEQTLIKECTGHLVVVALPAKKNENNSNCHVIAGDSWGRNRMNSEGSAPPPPPALPWCVHPSSIWTRARIIATWCIN